MCDYTVVGPWNAQRRERAYIPTCIRIDLAGSYTGRYVWSNHMCISTLHVCSYIIPVSQLAVRPCVYRVPIQF